MADGATFIELDDQLADQARQRAVAVGRTLEDYVRGVLEEEVYGLADLDWSDPPEPRKRAEDHRIAEETLRNGDGMSLDAFRVWMADFGRRGAKADT